MRGKYHRRISLQVPIQAHKHNEGKAFVFCTANKVANPDHNEYERLTRRYRNSVRIVGTAGTTIEHGAFRNIGTVYRNQEHL